MCPAGHSPTEQDVRDQLRVVASLCDLSFHFVDDRAAAKRIHGEPALMDLQESLANSPVHLAEVVSQCSSRELTVVFRLLTDELAARPERIENIFPALEATLQRAIELEKENALADGALTAMCRSLAVHGERALPAIQRAYETIRSSGKRLYIELPHDERALLCSAVAASTGALPWALETLAAQFQRSPAFVHQTCGAVLAELSSMVPVQAVTWALVNLSDERSSKSGIACALTSINIERALGEARFALESALAAPGGSPGKALETALSVSCIASTRAPLLDGVTPAEARSALELVEMIAAVADWRITDEPKPAEPVAPAERRSRWIGVFSRFRRQVESKTEPAAAAEPPLDTKLGPSDLERLVRCYRVALYRIKTTGGPQALDEVRPRCFATFLPCVLGVLDQEPYADKRDRISDDLARSVSDLLTEREGATLIRWLNSDSASANLLSFALIEQVSRQNASVTLDELGVNFLSVRDRLRALYTDSAPGIAHHAVELFFRLGAQDGGSDLAVEAAELLSGNRPVSESSATYIAIANAAKQHLTLTEPLALRAVDLIERWNEEFVHRPLLEWIEASFSNGERFIWPSLEERLRTIERRHASGERKLHYSDHDCLVRILHRATDTGML